MQTNFEEIKHGITVKKMVSHACHRSFDFEMVANTSQHSSHAFTIHIETKLCLIFGSSHTLTACKYERIVM